MQKIIEFYYKRIQCKQNSLRKLTEAEIREKQPMLFPRWKERLIDSITLNHTICFTFIGLLIGIIACIIGSYIGIIPINIDTAKSVIDQRISNLATIIGTSLTVATLLINNVANKRKESYEIMFKKTYLRGTVITTLLIFAFLLTISFSKDIIAEIFPAFYCNLYGLSYLLIFSVLSLIGRLFYNLIHIFDPLFLQTGIKVELEKATKKEILNVLVNKKIIENYEQRIKTAFDVEEIPAIINFTLPENYQSELIFNLKDAGIIDVKIKTITDFIKKNRQKFDQEEIHRIGHIFSSINSYNNLGFNRNSFAFKIIKKSFKKDKIEKETLSFNNLYGIVRSDFDRIFKASANDFNETELENIFSNYKVIYKTFFDCIVKSKDKPFYTEFKVIELLHFDFKTALEVAISKENIILIKKILFFNYSQVIQGLLNFSFETFNAFLDIDNKLISISPKIALSNFVAKEKSNYFYHIYCKVLYSRIEQNNDIINTEYDIYLENIIQHWCKFLYDIIESKNYEAFKITYKKLKLDVFPILFEKYSQYQHICYDINEGKVSYENLDNFNKEYNSEYLFTCSTLLIYSWTISRINYSSDKDDIDLYTKMLNEIEIMSYGEENILLALNTLSEGYNSRNTWGFIRNWGYFDLNSNSFIRKSIDTNWLFTGYIIYNFTQGIYSNQFAPNITFYNLDSKFSQSFEIVKNNSLKYPKFFKYQNMEDFENNKKAFLSFFYRCNFIAERKREKDIAEQNITNEIENIKKEIKRDWRRKSEFYTIFEKNNAIVKTQSYNSNECLGIVDKIYNIKPLFFNNNWDLHLLITNWINTAKSSAEQHLLYQILNSKKIIDSINIENAIIQAISKMEKSGIEVNLIMLSKNLHRELNMDRSFKNEKKYSNNFIWQDNEKWTYKDIEIIKCPSNEIKNLIVVCNVNKAFQVEITEQRHRLAKQIFFDIKELSVEDIQWYLEQYPDFKKGDNNIELTNEEAVYKLKNYLSVSFYINSNINILNPDAYEIISIKN